MKVVVLAGGAGNRLHPRTRSIPKCLLPVGGLPLLETVFFRLHRSGFTDVVCCVSHLGEAIEGFVETFQETTPDLRIECVYDQVSRGTAGPLKQLRGLTETFLVAHGDILTDINISSIVESHQQYRPAMTIVATELVVPIRFGLVETDDRSQLIELLEKPTLKYRVSAGIYVCEPCILDHIPSGPSVGMPDVIASLRAADHCVRVKAVPDSYWIDIGTEEDYQRAVTDAIKGIGPASVDKGSSVPAREHGS